MVEIPANIDMSVSYRVMVQQDFLPSSEFRIEIELKIDKSQNQNLELNRNPPSG